MKKIILLLLPLLFLSCNKEETISGKVRPETLVISSRLYTPVTEQKFLYDEIFPEFEEENNVLVKFEIMSDEDLIARAHTQNETGRITADIIIAHNSYMEEWITKDYVEALPVDQWPERTFSPAFTQYIKSDGQYYFAPVGGDVYLLMANKKAMPYLRDDAEVQALTWKEYAQWAIDVAEAEGEGKVAVTGIPRKSFIYFCGALFLSNGGTFPILNSDEAMEGWNLLYEMRESFFSGVLNCDNISPPMKSGEAWLTVAHMARIGEVYRNRPDDFVIAPAPRGDSGIGSIAGTSGFAVLKGSENKEMAFRFIEFMTRPEIAVRVARGTGGFIPPINEAVDELGDSPSDLVIKNGVMVLSEGVVSGVPGNEYTSWGEVKQVYDDLFQQIVIDKIKPDRTMINQAQSRIDSLKK